MKRSTGFSLIELVVAMLIAAILAAIAIPSYSNYVRKAHRTDAKNALLDLASLEERFFSTNNTYSSTWSDLGYSGASAVTIGNGYYTVAVPTVVAATAPTATTVGVPATYTLVATAINDQLKDTTCRTYTVNSIGTRTATDASSVDSTANCW